MQQLLTGNMRFPGFDGAVEIPQADELFKTVSQKADGDKEELLAVTQDQGVLPETLERRVVMPRWDTAGYKLVVPW